MYDLLEGEHIILRKAEEKDYKTMLKNVWGDSEVYQWMLFQPTLELFSMSIKELMNPNYKGCLHELSKNDLIRMRELATFFEYQNVINYMIKHNIKLEQEIICLDLMGKL